MGALPWGTLLVNVTGAGALGFVVGRLRTPGVASPLAALVATGTLGAYTTFSALAVELVGTLTGAPSAAVLHGLGSIALGLGAAGAGLAAGGRRRRDRVVRP